MKSYEEFEQEFKDNEPSVSPVQQAIRDRISRILNQRHAEVSKFGVAHVKRELQLLDLHTEDIEIIEFMSQQGAIEGNPTNEVYADYLKYCADCGIHRPMSQIHFSLFVIKYFEYEIIDKKIARKKRRLFVRSVSNKTFGKRNEDWWK